MFTGLSSKHFHLNSGTNVILATVDNPSDRGNDKDNAKGGNTVVCFSVSREM
jgi:hypothetical protein